jgi:phage terminase small subunit
MGNKPKPPELRVFEGNRGHRPIPNSPKPSRGRKFPNAPRYLDQIAQREWRLRGKELFSLGLLTILDLPAFEAYCDWYSIWRGAKTATAKKEAAHQMRMFMLEFGMTPSSRTKVNVDKAQNNESEWEELIGVRLR